MGNCDFYDIIVYDIWSDSPTSPTSEAHSPTLDDISLDVPAELNDEMEYHVPVANVRLRTRVIIVCLPAARALLRK